MRCDAGAWGLTGASGQTGSPGMGTLAQATGAAQLRLGASCVCEWCVGENRVQSGRRR